MFAFAKKTEQDDSAVIHIDQRGEVNAILAAREQMLDNMPINVMTLDLESFSIDYVNKTKLNTGFQKSVGKFIG